MAIIVGVVKMEKIDRGNIHCATYSRECPFDVAQSIIDEMDGVDVEDVKRIVELLWLEKALTPFGVEILIAIEAIKYGEVQNFYASEKMWNGVNKYAEMCEKFEKWKEGNVHIKVGG